MKRILLAVTFIFLILVTLVTAQNELFNKALQQFDAKQYEQAAATFKQVIVQSPEFYQAHFNLGLCQYNLKQYDEAIASFQKSVSIKPDYVRANYWLGNALVNRKRLGEAIIWYQKTIQFEPNNSNAHYRLGLVHQETKKYPEAEKEFKKAFEINPKFIESKNELGNVYVSLKKFPEAIVAFNDALLINPDYPDSHLGLGNAYYNDNKFAESIPYYKKASELLPGWATAHLYLGDSYFKTKQYSLAIVSYENAIRLDSQRVNAYYGLGLTYVVLKNRPLAQKVLADLKNLDSAKANLLQIEIDKMTGGASIPPPQVKSAQRIKDEEAVAKMVDFGFDAAVVTQIGTIRETPKATGKLLLSVKRNDILSLVARADSNDWFQVVDEKTGIEGWVDGKTVVVKFTNNKVTGPPLLEDGAGVTAEANPVISISNLEKKTTLSLKLNGVLYKIPPQSTKTVSLAPGKLSFYGWSPGIRPAVGSSVLAKGRKYSWTFQINRP